MAKKINVRVIVPVSLKACFDLLRIAGLAGFSFLWIVLQSNPLHAEPTKKPKNPFLLPHGVFSTSHLPVPDKVVLVLQAIIASGKKKVATINNQNFSQGELAFGKKVVEILSDRVILDASGNRVVLLLKQPMFSIKVKSKP